MIPWVIKYKPKNWNEWLGNDEIKNVFKHMKQKDMINYIFAGPPGVGKSLASELIGELNFKYNYQEKNMSSSQGHVKEIEKWLIEYCMQQTFSGSKRKLVILSEADGLTRASQKFMRHPMEEYAIGMCFIITCNYPSKIIEAIHSRSCTMYFKSADESSLREYIERIIRGENLKINESQIKDIIKRSKGKFRNVANTLQGWTVKDKTLYPKYDDMINDVSKSFSKLRNLDLDGMMKIFDGMLSSYVNKDIIVTLSDIIVESSIPPGLKSRMLISCCDCMKNIELGVDEYVAFWGLASQFYVYGNNLKKK